MPKIVATVTDNNVIPTKEVVCQNAKCGVTLSYSPDEVRTIKIAASKGNKASEMNTIVCPNCQQPVKV